jgi:SNF2 family DNA or RNA helicase
VATAELSGADIVMTIGPREVHLIRTVPGAKYHPRCKVKGHPGGEHWATTGSWASCVALRGVFGKKLEVGPDLKKWARRELRDRVTPAMEVRDLLEYDLPGYFRAGKLRPPQRAAVGFLQIAEHAILGDGMGSGKSVILAALGAVLDATPALVVCPNSTKFQWARFIEKWWGARPQVVTGSANARRACIARVRDGEADVAIINWEALRLHTRLSGWGSAVRLTEKEREPKELNEIPWKMAVADEGHRAANPRAKQTRAWWAVSADAQFRYSGTGTVTKDTVEDLWCVGRGIEPDEYPSKTAFLDRYAFTGWNPWGGLEILGLRDDTKDELFSFLDARFIRRPKKVLMPWLPEKTRSRRDAELGPKQRRAYDAMAKEMLAEIPGGAAVVTNALAKATRLRQFAASFAELVPCKPCDGSGASQRTGKKCKACGGSGRRVLMTEPSCKVDVLMELAEELGDERAVVMSESKQLVNLAAARLAKRGFEVGLITGDFDDYARDKVVRDFGRGDLQYVLLTLGAGGEGLDGLQDAAATGIFLQRSFAQWKNEQAEDRIHRDGQRAKKVSIIDVESLETIESRVREVGAEKDDKFEEIVRDAETFKRLLGRK